MGIFASMNVEVKTHMDPLEDEDLERLSKLFARYPDGVIPEGGTFEEVTAPEPAEPPVVEVEEEPKAPPALAETVAPAAPARVFMPPVDTAPVRPQPPLPPTVRPTAPLEAKPEAEKQPEGIRKPVGIPDRRPSTRPLTPDQRPQRSFPPPAATPSATSPRRPGATEAPKRPDTAAKPDRPPLRPLKPRRSETADDISRADRLRKLELENEDPEFAEWARAKAVPVPGAPVEEPVVEATESTDGKVVDAAAGARRRRGKRRKKPTASVAEIQASVQRTLNQMGRGRVRRTYERHVQTSQTGEVEETNVLRVSEFVSVSELADMMGVKATEVIATCLKLGTMVSVNQRLEMDTIQIIADEFGFEIQQMQEIEVEEIDEEEDSPESLVPRPPVVTVMGHVDHGKTSLLDYIRSTNVIAGESGGITQHIGAYEVETPQGRIAFLDTPGHEAFTAMRSRGAQVTDVVVLVVAADDNVMPQTIEAINHARAAQVPIIVAINKVDLPVANPDRIKQQLTQYGVILEEFGGQTQSVEVSAKFGQGVDTLLERLALETELMELKANPNRDARGVIIEARLDKGRGPVATVLVQSGTLRVGDAFLAGMQAGRVRALLDERGNPVKDAGPSRPVQVLGFDDVPTAGDKFGVFESEREAREIAQYRQQIKREQDYSRIKKVSLTDLKRRISEGELRMLPVIVKGDVDGSVEALSDELARLTNSEVAIQVIHRGVGAISESDVLLASASNAIIIGFHVRPDTRARELAAQEQVEIRLYQVIYEAIEEVKASLAGLLDAKITEQVTGTAEIRQIFKVPRAGNVAGCMVRSGTITRGSRVRIMRDGAEAYNGKIDTLRRVKEDVREVPSGFECGISIENFNDIKVGDIIESYIVVEEARTLESVAS
jgi:translation initiation factor IF-2